MDEVPRRRFSGQMSGIPCSVVGDDKAASAARSTDIGSGVPALRRAASTTMVRARACAAKAASNAPPAPGVATMSWANKSNCSFSSAPRASSETDDGGKSLKYSDSVWSSPKNPGKAEGDSACCTRWLVAATAARRRRAARDDSYPTDASPIIVQQTLTEGGLLHKCDRDLAVLLMRR